MQATEGAVIRWLLATAALAALLTVQPATAGKPASPRAYAQERARTAYGWTGYEWQAIDAIVTPESGWNPCARYPGRIECFYAGRNSCGIPQANPCPAAWRGRLGATWREQVEWLLRYIRGRYGSPSRALAVRRSQGWY